MESIEVYGNRGAKIKPSARKSIHSHKETYESSRDYKMGKYGINVHKSKQLTPQDGCDETDNALSKMARPSSPIMVQKSIPVHRRNSVDVSEKNNDYSSNESDDEHILSTSSPPTFLYFSEEINTSVLNEQNSRNNSKYSLDTSQRSRYNDSVDLQNNSLPIQSQSKTTLYNLIIVAVIVLICAAYIYNPSHDHTTTYDKSQFYNDVGNIEKIYNVKHTSILQLKTGIASIYEKQDAGAFIFTYNSNIVNFNPVKFNSFIEDIAQTASRYLRNEGKDVHIVVDNSEITMESVYEFINKYREGLDRTGVMLVKDIYNVPSELAMAFHYYCDEYNPLVKKSAIFFTLNLSNCTQQDPKSTHDYIEKCLAKKWNSIEEDKIGPLLTRVVNIVIDVSNIY